MLETDLLRDGRGWEPGITTWNRATCQSGKLHFGLFLRKEKFALEL
jgi:hypothetical protein